ncbi:MAG: glycosyltransferase family 4 protein [Fibrobacter sp.]|jgi:glycosyltransferase involved in cell wall biosynthesis|nr:glycosyltransferase family 4 protein [Fibrobacter sp.]
MSILIYIPYPTNEGYAINQLESAFFEMSRRVFSNDNQIHFLYRNLSGGFPKFLPPAFSNVISIDDQLCSSRLGQISSYIKQNSISILFGLDLPVKHLFYKPLRRAGLKLIISYWGAPMSDFSPAYILFLKKLQVFLSPSMPDHFIFESKSMAKSATCGRGINPSRISIVKLGVDPQKYSPQYKSSYIYRIFNIPSNRKVIIYSGHMEERKGVDVIIRAAAYMVNQLHRYDIHFLIAGNKNGEECRFYHLYQNSNAVDHITFAGYRDDLSRIFPCCYAGVIASTGWDSFTVSSLEMASSGLPLVVSNLQGLSESIEADVTGFLFNTGDHLDLVSKLILLLDNPNLHNSMSKAARERILHNFSFEQQIVNLSNTLKTVISRKIRSKTDADKLLTSSRIPICQKA